MKPDWLPLIAFRVTPGTANLKLEARAEKTAAGVRIAFRIPSEMDLPSVKHGVRRDELWKNTCFEGFFRVAGSTRYFEFNGALTGDWAWYAFDDYRAGMRAPPLTPATEPKRVGALEWLIPVECFGQDVISHLSLTAVIEHAGETSYWALKHAREVADFHAPESFIAANIPA